jgi:hypothetical protein
LDRTSPSAAWNRDIQTITKTGGRRSLREIADELA